MLVKYTTVNWSCEPMAAILPIIGSLLIAMNNGVQFFGFLAYFVANILSMYLFVSKKLYWLVAQQCGFICTSLIGLHLYK